MQSTLPRIIQNEGFKELSIYAKSNPSTEVVIWAVKTLQGCFPDTNPVVFEVIVERFKERMWSDERIKDAVNKLTETHPYRSINPANILSFDLRRKVYDYTEMCNYVNKNGGTTSQFTKIEVNGRIFWTK